MSFDWKKVAIYTQLAYTFPAAVFVPSFIGWFLDGRLGTAPWLLFIGFVVGLAAGFATVFRTLREEGKGGDG